MNARPITMLLSLALAATVAAGCGSSSDSSKTASKTTTDHAAMSTTSTATPTSSKALDTRVKLVELLTEHSMLATDATQQGLFAAPEFPQTLTALKANGTDLAAVIGSVYGEDAKAKFDTLWQGHIDDLVAYTVATAKHDAAGTKRAEADLDTYVEQFGTFLATATGLPADAVKAEVKAHVQQHAGIIDDTAAKRYDDAWKLQRASYQHMAMLGTTLANAIAKQQHLDDGDVTTSAADTRVKLDTLLGEHTALATAATTKALAGAPDFTAAAAALDANTGELADVIGSVYGPKAKAAFTTQWKQHIGYLVDYTTAVAKQDGAGQAKAKRELDAYETSFGAFLAKATGLPADAVRGALQAHVQHHVGIIDAYHAKDYAQSNELGRAAFDHMFTIGDTLVAAIVKQHPDSFTA
jgi:hypothetical protein